MKSCYPIDNLAFSDCLGLTTVTLGDGLEEIGKGSFACCRSVNEISIPNAVKTIENSAFAYCPGLTTVTLDNGLEEIGENAFCRCRALHEIV